MSCHSDPFIIVELNQPGNKVHIYGAVRNVLPPGSLELKGAGQKNFQKPGHPMAEF